MPVVGEALAWTGGFPVRRGESDRERVRTARDLVREGAPPLSPPENPPACSRRLTGAQRVGNR